MIELADELSDKVPVSIPFIEMFPLVSKIKFAILVQELSSISEASNFK